MKKSEKLLKNKNILTLWISVIIFVIIWFLSVLFNFFIPSNTVVQNIILDVAHKAKVSKDIIVIEIDEKTTTGLERFPFDRKVYAPVIQRLNEAWASIIAFDVIFADKTNDQSDKIFSDAVKRAWNVIFWLSFSQNWLFEFPIDNIKKYAKDFWFFSPRIHPVTNNADAYYPVLSDKQKTQSFEFFPLVIAKNYLGIWGIWVKTQDFYNLWNDISLPFWYKNSPLVYVNHPEIHNYQKVSFIDIYDENEFERIKNNVDFKDKIIIIWATAKGIKDTFQTSEWIMYGVYFHANVLSNILHNDAVKFLSKHLEWIIFFLIMNVSIFFNLHRSGKILIWSNITVLIIFAFFFPVLLYSQAWLLVNYYYELIVWLIISLAWANIVKYLIENKHKNKLNKALWEYVSKDIAAEILSGSGKINLDGESKKITMFFSDIEWFTTISEKFTPATLVKFLREYLSSMSDIILDLRWFINKYEWDAIMALWWVFGGEHKENVYEACEAALQQQETLKKLNIWWETEWFSQIKARIWIHCWDAIIWNIWSAGRKMEFTALWDNVNLASRLEWVNKFYGTYICVSQEVVEATRDKFSYRYLDKIRVKWKDTPVIIYELLSRKWCIDDDKKSIVLDYTKAIELYLAWDFESAKDIFKKCWDNWDAPSYTYFKRCQKFIYEKTPENWDGVWNFDEK